MSANFGHPIFLSAALSVAPGEGSILQSFEKIKYFVGIFFRGDPENSFSYGIVFMR
jgi:hypothetical protein